MARIYQLLRLNSLKRRFRFWFVLLILIILLSSVPILIYGQSYRQDEAQQHIQQMINLQQLVIERWFEERMDIIDSISQLPAVREGDKEKLAQVLETFDTSHNEFTGIVYVNKVGVSEIDTEGPVGINLSDRMYFQEAKKGKSYVTDVLIGRQSHQAIIIFSSPVFDYQQHFQGLIFGSVRLDRINEVMKKFRFSETGQTYLVNRDGLLLTDLRFADQWNQTGSMAHDNTINTEIVREAIIGKNINHSYHDYRGLSVIGDYRWINDQKWLIIGEIATKDVSSPFSQMMVFFLGVLFIVLILGSGFIFLITQQIEIPIYEVLKGTRRMGKAKYDYRIEANSYAQYPVEMLELCETFNEMAEMIQYQIHSLRKSEERYRALVENSPNAIVVHQEGKIVYVNPACIRLIKASSENDLIGRRLVDLVHPEYRELVNERIQQLQRSYSVGLLEEKYVLLDGSIIDVEVIATPIEYMNKPASQIIIKDITSRKQMERELQKAADELRESEERFRLLAEYSSDMITLHDVRGKYLYVSPACTEILQYHEDEMVGQDSYVFIHPDDQELIKNNYAILLDSGYVVSTYRIRRKDGAYVWFESSIKMLYGSKLHDSQLIVVSRNINERKEVEQKLRQANEMLQLLSSTDGLTGVGNRRAFDDRLLMEWDRCRRNSTPLSLIMLDIDYFKAYNDTYGHQGGDGCLQEVATAIQDALGRSGDMVCRYGGEEFVAILPETDDVGSKLVAERIRSVIEALEIPHISSRIADHLTISLGTATMVPTSQISYTELIEQADRALYQAKQEGRNRVRSYNRVSIYY